MNVGQEIQDAVSEQPEQTTAPESEVNNKTTEVSGVLYTYKAQEGTKLVSFDQALKDFVGSTASSMRSAQLATDLAIVHFYNTGDLSFCQKFLDAIPKNYVRKIAYKAWLSTHAPIKMDGERLLKDKRPEATEFFGGSSLHPMNEEHVAKALAICFWDFKPEPEDIEYGEGDIIVQLLKTATKMRGGRYNLTDAAMTKLSAAEKALNQLK